jgi:hypothetical protein
MWQAATIPGMNAKANDQGGQPTGCCAEALRKEKKENMKKYAAVKTTLHSF